MNGDAKFAYDVFLSHNAQDEPRVRRLAERLRANGWNDPSQLSTLNSQPPAGQAALPDALRRCKVADFREESEAAFSEVLATGQAETGTMKRRFGLPHGGRRANLRKRARQSNTTRLTPKENKA